MIVRLLAVALQPTIHGTNALMDGARDAIACMHMYL